MLLEPLARNALLSASELLVALLMSFPTIGNICCVVFTMLSSEVGNPSIPSESSLIAFVLSAIGTSMFFMTLGKLRKMSKRDTAPSILFMIFEMPTLATLTRPIAPAIDLKVLVTPACDCAICLPLFEKSDSALLAFFKVLEKDSSLACNLAVIV